MSGPRGPSAATVGMNRQAANMHSMADDFALNVPINGVRRKQSLLLRRT